MADETRAQGSATGSSPLREALDNAARIFWCNTNRGAGAGQSGLERRMHARRFAAAWLPFNYEDHMRRVRAGDVVFMYANGVGVIGIGRATESRLEILAPDHPDRIRAFATEGENEEEWRIPVEWLVWDDVDPCPVAPPLRPSFTEITHHGDRVHLVRDHYLSDT